MAGLRKPGKEGKGLGRRTQGEGKEQAPVRVFKAMEEIRAETEKIQRR